MLPYNIPVWSLFEHHGPARTLMHRLKYQERGDLARFLSPLLASLLPSGTKGLVPIPRVRTRVLRYGLDPAKQLAQHLAAATGLPLWPLLRPTWWGKVHAGRRSSSRQPPRFKAIAPAPPGAVLVDDVVTTGLTLTTAAQQLKQVLAAVTATGTAPSAYSGSEPPADE